MFPLEKTHPSHDRKGECSLKEGACSKGHEDAWFTRFALNAFTPAARPDSFGHNFLICDPNLVILDSLESLKSLVSKGSAFTGFGLAG